VLANSSRAIKLCIVITDGWWGNQAECDKVIRQLRMGGVLTSLGYIEIDNSSYGITKATNTTIDTHGCEIAANITDISQLFVLGRALVKAGISRNLANV
jgi:hypothetical protein